MSNYELDHPNQSMADGVNPYQRDKGHGNVSVLGPTVVVRGELSADEDLIIKGTVEGYIDHKKHLTISKQGKVNANTKASSVLVEGQLTGDIYGTKGVLIHNTSTVTGNIYSPCVSLLEGAKFSGSIDMDIDPVKMAKSRAPSKLSTQKSNTSAVAKSEVTDTAEFNQLTAGNMNATQAKPRTTQK